MGRNVKNKGRFTFLQDTLLVHRTAREQLAPKQTEILWQKKRPFLCTDIKRAICWDMTR